MNGGCAGAIHPAAVIDSGARLGAGVAVGAFSVVGPEVEIGAGARIGTHVHLTGRTRLGAGVRVFPFASVGEIPQDLKYRGEDSRLVVGDGTVIREHATLHAGTAPGGGITRVGQNCLLMVGVHVAHDCRVGDHAILANGVGLSGHVQLDEHVVMGAMVGVHQHCRIGAHVMVGAMSAVDADIPPFCLGVGNRARFAGLNLVGLRRRGFPAEVIRALQAAAAELLAGEGTLADRIDRVRSGPVGAVREVGRMADFIAAARGRPLLRAA